MRTWLVGELMENKWSILKMFKHGENKWRGAQKIHKDYRVFRKILKLDLA